jgi:hypothetical protein
MHLWSLLSARVAGACPVCLYFTLAKHSVNERAFALYTSANDGQVFLFGAVRVARNSGD